MFFFFLLKVFRARSLAVMPLLSCTMSDMRLALARAPTVTASNSQIPLFRYHAPTFSGGAFPVSFGFLFPKVCQDQQIPQTSAPRQPPPSSAPLLLTLPALRRPSLLVHMQRKEASPLWQQQNTTLQKRCAPLTVTIKKGVDRIRAGDDDLRGRDAQKEARREQKRFLSSVSIFSYLFFFFFFIFSGFIKPHLTHV